jgi:positive regulator of sigma E activity
MLGKKFLSIGDKIAPIFNYDQSIFSMLVGFLFLVAAFFFVKAKGKELSKKDAYKPKIIRILKNNQFIINLSQSERDSKRV